MMGLFYECLSLSLLSIFVQNIVFTRALGSCELLKVARKPEKAVPFSLLLTVFCVMTAVLTWLWDQVIRQFDYISYTRPFSYIVIIGVVYLLAYFVLRRFFPKLFFQVHKLLPYAALNSCVLGVCLLSARFAYTLPNSIGFALGSGLGFLVATLLVGEGQKRLDALPLPRAFRGVPALLIYVGILSLAFFGLSGHAMSY